MPFEIGWCVENRVIYERVSGDVDFEATASAANHVSTLLNAGIAPVHLVIEMSELKSFPTNVSKIHTVTQFMRSPALGWVVVIGSSSLATFFINVIRQIIKFPVVHQPSLDQGLAFLREQDASLPGAEVKIAS
jgi:hypothetical protein